MDSIEHNGSFPAYSKTTLPAHQSASSTLDYLTSQEVHESFGYDAIRTPFITSDLIHQTMNAITEFPLWDVPFETFMMDSETTPLLSVHHNKKYRCKTPQSQLSDSPGSTTSSSDAYRICSNCGTNSAPTWRRDPSRKFLLCNACGLYLKLHGKNRMLMEVNGVFKVRRSAQPSFTVNKAPENFLGISHACAGTQMCLYCF